jgi:hypothetical protein
MVGRGGSSGAGAFSASALPEGRLNPVASGQGEMGEPALVYPRRIDNEGETRRSIKSN